MVYTGYNIFSAVSSTHTDANTYISYSTTTYEIHYAAYENINPYLPSKIIHNTKAKIQPFKSKLSIDVKHRKHFSGHNFRIGRSKK